jgi:large subunit ribosomal protein L23
MKRFGILKEILLTEKSNALLADAGKYVFVVSHDANKNQIARAVEAAFDVKVDSVNVIHCRGKAKRVRSRMRNLYTIVGNKKKAVVALKSGYKIDVA